MGKAWENHWKMVIYIVIMAGWWWLEPWNFMTFHSVGNGIIMPTDEVHHFFRGVGTPTIMCRKLMFNWFHQPKKPVILPTNGGFQSKKQIHMWMFATRNMQPRRFISNNNDSTNQIIPPANSLTEICGLFFFEWPKDWSSDSYNRRWLSNYEGIPQA